MSKTIAEHMPALERMLSDVLESQAENTRWATLTSATVDLAKSQVRLEQKVEGLDKRVEGLDKRVEGLDKRVEGLDKRVEGLDKRVEGLDKKVDNVVQRLGLIEDDMRFVRSHIERVVDKTFGSERPEPKGDPAAE